jgi:hypothetical protein
LEQEQREKQASQQRVANVIHQRNFGHRLDMDVVTITLSSVATQLQRTASSVLIWFFDQDNRCAGEKSEIHGLIPFLRDHSSGRVTLCGEGELVADGRRVAENAWGAKSGNLQ